MKILFCGGGTVGHITPAVAIAEQIKKTKPSSSIIFVGREGGAENTAITQAGFIVKTVKIQGFERKISLKNFKTFFIAIESLKKAKKIIKDFSPDIVVGTGGYVTWPVIRAAQLLKIPTVIHESNACPGLVTKLLSQRCNKVLLNLEGSEKEFKRRDNIKIVGNPVRDEFLKISREEARKKLGIKHSELLISSFGGSGGSEKINEIIIEVMKHHSSKKRNIKHIHCSGKKYYPEIRKKHPELINEIDGCVIKPYIDDMATVILASDIVISRCGAMTLSEICATGTVSILIPSPNVTNNHQYKNAKLICDSNGAVMLEEKELNMQSIVNILRELESSSQKRKAISENCRKFYVKNSKEMIVDEIIKLI